MGARVDRQDGTEIHEEVSIAVKVIVAIGLAVVIGALVFALTSGHVFLFPFLLILGIPMVAVFRPRPPPPPAPPQTPPKISLN